MSVSSATRKPPPQEWMDSAVPAMIRANRARLAQHSAERAFRNPAEVPPFDQARRDTASCAKAYLDRHYQEPFSMEDLCRAAGGAGVRTLQRRFMQSYGVSVRSYLKTVRLDAAYRELTAADATRDTVTTIALNNGCSHLGRFASEFRERFGLLPRETLTSVRA